jgi:hypothetical protein
LNILNTSICYKKVPSYFLVISILFSMKIELTGIKNLSFQKLFILEMFNFEKNEFRWIFSKFVKLDLVVRQSKIGKICY